MRSAACCPLAATPRAALPLVPYLLRATVAAALSVQIWRLNSEPRRSWPVREDGDPPLGLGPAPGTRRYRLSPSTPTNPCTRPFTVHGAIRA